MANDSIHESGEEAHGYLIASCAAESTLEDAEGPEGPEASNSWKGQNIEAVEVASFRRDCRPGDIESHAEAISNFLAWVC